MLPGVQQLQFLDNYINIYWIYKFVVFKDRDDITKQTWEHDRVSYKFRDLDDTTEQFTSLKTEMTQPNKFNERLWTLLVY